LLNLSLTFLQVRLRDTAHLLSAATFQEMMDWLTCIQSIAFDIDLSKSSINNLAKNNVMTESNSQCRSLSDQVPSISFQLASETEENLLYSSVNSSEEFKVKVAHSEATERCGLSDKLYLLILSASSISLAEDISSAFCDKKILWTWPYRHIRRYGCTKDGFSLEAGRKCPSGEGIFAFITNEGSEIFKKVASQVNWLKSSHPKCSLQSCVSISNQMTGDKKGQSQNNLECLNVKSENVVAIVRPECSTAEVPKKNLNVDFTIDHTSSPSACVISDMSSSQDLIRIDESSNRVILKVNCPSIPLKDHFNNNLTKSSPVLPIRTFSSNNFSKQNSINESSVSDPLYEDPIFVSREELFGLQNELPQKSNHSSSTTENGLCMNVAQKNLSKNAPIFKFTSVIKSMLGVNLVAMVNRRKKQKARKANSNGSSDSSQSSLSNHSGLDEYPASKFLGSPLLQFCKTNGHLKNKFNENEENSELNKVSQANHFKLVSDADGYSNICNLIHNQKSLNKSAKNVGPQHYVKNEAEYALIMKSDFDCVDL